MGFPSQEYWRGWPFPSPGDLADPRIKPSSPALAGGFFTTEPPGKPTTTIYGAPIACLLFYPCQVLAPQFSPNLLSFLLAFEHARPTI